MRVYLVIIFYFFLVIVVDSFKTVDWEKNKDTMFTADDKISDKAIDAFLQSKEIMRELKECSITDALAADNDTEACVKAKQYYSNMENTVTKMKAKIAQIEQDKKTTPERKMRALEIKARIAKIEDKSIETPTSAPESHAIQNVHSFCLFILASVLYY